MFDSPRPASTPGDREQPSRLERILHSLRFKSTLAITITLVLIFSGYTALRFESHRELDLQEAQNQVAQANNLIQATLHHAMLTDDLTDLTSIIDNVGQQRGVSGIYLLDSDGRIRFSHPGQVPNSQDESKNNPAISIDRTSVPASSSNGTLLTLRDGDQVLRSTNLIANQASCYACHDSRQAVLGYLVTDLALTETNRQLALDLQGNIFTGLVTILIIVVAINFLLGRSVLGKLEQFAPILQHFGQGDLSQRLPLQGNDEIGQLAAAFNRTAESLQARERENARLYQQLVEKEAARTGLLHKVIVAQEDERKRLARELHDDFSQALTALSVTVQSAVETVPSSLPALQHRLQSMQELTTNTLGEASRWIQDLRPRVLDELGLVPAIRSYAETRLEPSGGQVQIQAHDFKEPLPPEIEITLFRVIQEALSNIARHAHARNILIRLDLYESGIVVAHVEDDGIGFVPAKFLHATDGLKGMGLLDMRERVALLGGTLTIDSTPGRGTRIRAEVPWKEMVRPSAS